MDISAMGVASAWGAVEAAPGMGARSEEARAYLESEAALAPVRSFIDGAVPSTSIQTCETFALEMDGRLCPIEVLNFTDSTVHVRVFDMENFRAHITSTIDTLFNGVVAMFIADTDRLEAQGGHEELVDGMNSNILYMTLMASSIKSEAVAMIFEEGMEGIELQLNDGESHFFIPQQEPARVVLLPHSQESVSEHAQEPCYVLTQRVDTGELTALLALDRKPIPQEPDEAELWAAFKCYVEEATDGTVNVNPSDSVLRQLWGRLLPFLRSETLRTEGLETTKLLSEVQGFASF